ncbi:MAG: histidine--tRNA ligase [Candidatus Peregrinibacteria bacterium]|nr:histidine--tRNA ligase [Candidatus Peregrinibacteria bacterium]
MSKNIIEPKILKGTRDFLPLTQVRRNFVINKIREVFERYGYDPIETPILSYAETLLGKYGDEGDKLTYNFDDRGGRRIALPYDLTVPTARYVAANWQELAIPFKRYQIQRVWRAEKPQKGRLREFYQCDIDVIGTRSLVADVEIAKVTVAIFEALGFKKFTVKVNSRRLMNEILKSLGFEGNPTAIITTIDKMDKIGKEGVTAELKEKGIADDKIEALFKAFDDKDFSAYDNSEIDEFMRLCGAFSIDKNRIEFDPYLARGLDYYTGMIYEVVSEDVDLGCSMAGGGRYDDLCSIFSKQDFPGVGISFGFERIMLALEQMGVLDGIGLSAQVLVTRFSEESADDSLSTLNALIEGGIKAEVYFEAAKLSKQFKYADKKNTPFVVTRGPEEIENNQITVKNMQSGEQTTIPFDELVSYIKG